MRLLRCFSIALICIVCSVPSPAQKEKRDPLTGEQTEQIREAGTDPAERVKLYAKFLDEHVEAIKALMNRPKSPGRGKKLQNELQDATALMDELGSNLDVYSDRKADIRKSLKPLTEASQRWVNTYKALVGEPAFELARKEAIESGEDLTDQAKRLLDEQTVYFQNHKDESGQQRAEPKSVE